MTPPPPPGPPLLGTRLVAGLGYATVLPDMDFETRSPAGYVWHPDTLTWSGPPGASGTSKGLPVVGAEPYARHPGCTIIWLAYDLKDGAGRRRWRPGLPPPGDLLGYLAMGGLIEAWNVAFERWIWNLHCVPRLGWPAVRDDQWRCAMAKARASAYPGSLGKAGEVLALTTQKDPRGEALMKKFSMPRKPTAGDSRLWVMPVYDEADAERRAAQIVADAQAAEPSMSARKLVGVTTRAHASASEDLTDTLAYGDYCETDIASEAEASSLVPDLEGEELQWWMTHERINQRGIHVDRAGVENCIAIVEQAFAKYHGELVALTGIDSASKVQQILGWLHARGVHMDSLDEEAVETALALPLPPEARRVLEIRAAVGSASIKKLFAMRNRLSDDDRLRDLAIYHGARTGRCVAAGQQVRVRSAGSEVLDRAIEDVRADDQVWDGQEWVVHGGVVRSGPRVVVVHDGVTATPEHLVFVASDRAVTMATARREALPIFRGEAPCP